MFIFVTAPVWAETVLQVYTGRGRRREKSDSTRSPSSTSTLSLRPLPCLILFYGCSAYGLNTMKQGTANENAAGIRRVSCFGQLIRKYLVNAMVFVGQCHVHSVDDRSTSRLLYFLLLHRANETKQVETAVHGCSSHLWVWTLSFRFPVKSRPDSI